MNNVNPNILPRRLNTRVKTLDSNFFINSNDLQELQLKMHDYFLIEKTLFQPLTNLESLYVIRFWLTILWFFIDKLYVINCIFCLFSNYTEY